MGAKRHRGRAEASRLIAKRDGSHHAIQQGQVDPSINVAVYDESRRLEIPGEVSSISNEFDRGSGLQRPSQDAGRGMSAIRYPEVPGYRLATA